MVTTSVRLEHILDREGPVSRWILECPHGRWFADQRAVTGAPTKAAAIYGVLIPRHDKDHDPACTRALRDHYGPGGAGRHEL